MRAYNSFVIRYWRFTDSSRGDHSVIDIEHVQTGEHTRAKRLQDTHRLLRKMCEELNPGTKEGSNPGKPLK